MRKATRTFVLFVCANIALSKVAFAQDTNLFSVPSLTLTGAVVTAPAQAAPRTLGELRHEVQVLMGMKDYDRALKLAVVGLQVSTNDFPLLVARAVALTRLHRFPEAIAAHKEILVVAPSSEPARYGLAELYLITGKVDEYRALAAKHKAQIDAAYDGVLAQYFAVLAAYHTQDEATFRKTVIQILTSLPEKKERLLSDWQFDELVYVLSQQSNSRKNSMMMTFIRVLDGELTRDAAMRSIKSL